MRSSKTLLIGWDGADWEIARPLMESGLMPCLSALVAGGVAGELISFAPYLSPVLWTTIATGHHPDRHGVHGFAEVDPLTGEVRAVGSGSRKTKALWTIVSEQGGSVGVVGWMGSFPAEAVHGEFVSDAFAHAPAGSGAAWPVSAGSVYPPSLAEDLEDLRLRPEDVDPGLLGLFLPGLAAGMNEGLDDRKLTTLLRRLAQLYTLQNAAVAIVGRRQPDFLAVYFHFLDLICHEFAPYHPPRHPGVTVGDYRRYREVVSAAYRVQDALLADLLRHCAADTKVVLVSDHGFTTGAARPARTPRFDAGLAAWHRREGMVVMQGPGVGKGRRFAGVRPHDIAPTVLAWLGLPRGADMPGRVLEEMFTAAPADAMIPSWEGYPAAVPAPTSPAVEPEEGEQKRLTRRFVELGYLDPQARQGRDGGALVADENRAHLGTSLRDLGRSADALPFLQAAALAEPESPTRAVELAYCLLDLGLADEAERALRPFFDYGAEEPRALLLRAQLLIARRRFPQALQVLDRMAETPLAAVCGGLRRYILLRSGRFEEARAAFIAEIAKDPSRINPHLGLAQACLWTGRLDEAAEAVRQVLARDRASAEARSLLDELARCRAAGGRRPEPATWAVLTQEARRRAACRAALREREQVFHHKRAIRRSERAGAEGAASVRAPILVVSGAPRSGTSLMMRMLALAGVPVLTDGVRCADADNPLGYFEWEAAKRLAAEPGMIAHAEGKAVKVVSALLADLPGGWDYEVIFMRREARAILRSQEQMIARSGQGQVRLEDIELDRHIGAALAAARDNPRLRLIEMGYDDLLDRTDEAITRLAGFLGAGRIKRPGGLRSAIRRDLRHHATPAARGTSS